MKPFTVVQRSRWHTGLRNSRALRTKAGGEDVPWDVETQPAFNKRAGRTTEELLAADTPRGGK